MNADSILQELSVQVYEEPLSNVRIRNGFPDLQSPLDIAILLIDCDTELSMSGILGFLENSTGEHLEPTISALTIIGATKAAAKLSAVKDVMRSHGVTWESLRVDFADTSEGQITSFQELHGREDFSDAIDLVDFSELFYSDSEEDVYLLLCNYLDERIDILVSEIKLRKD